MTTPIVKELNARIEKHKDRQFRQALTTIDGFRWINKPTIKLSDLKAMARLKQ